MRRMTRSRTAKSRGPDTPTLVSSWRCCSRNTLTMVARKPGSPGRARNKPSTHRAGMPEKFRLTCSDYARMLFLIAYEAAGAANTRHSLRPLFVEGRTNLQNSDANAARE